MTPRRRRNRMREGPAAGRGEACGHAQLCWSRSGEYLVMTFGAYDEFVAQLGYDRERRQWILGVLRLLGGDQVSELFSEPVLNDAHGGTVDLAINRGSTALVGWMLGTFEQ